MKILTPIINKKLAENYLPTWLAVATTAGGKELENKYGRALWRNISIICFDAVVYPPAAPIYNAKKCKQTA